jgi:putative protein-disulfide isomerase
MSTLYYYHDPMCSWCWGYRPTAELLFADLPEDIVRENVLGGLAPDSDEPMSDELLERIPKHWRSIREMFGTEFNFDFWTECAPRRSTYPACRAVIAATKQGREGDMTLAIQQAYYLRAMNPSDTETLEALANEINLDSDRFVTDLHSPDTEAELQRQVAFARRSPINGLPGLALGNGDELTPVRLNYKDHTETLNHILAIIRPQPLVT